MILLHVCGFRRGSKTHSNHFAPPYKICSLAAVVLLAGCDPKLVTVTTTADSGAGSLRAAIDAANAAGAAGARIELAPGTYDLTRCSGDDANAGGDLDITTSAPVSLVAVGPNVVSRQTIDFVASGDFSDVIFKP
jgi:hypothetical protein